MGRKISLVTPSLFTHNGANVALGGAERYTRDLALLCRELGFEPTVRQFGVESWERSYEGIPVKAYPWNGDHADCVERIMQPDLASADHVIYVSLTTQRVYKPNSITICHGIWFDNQQWAGIDVAGWHIVPALQQAAAVVAVDLAFVQYCRSVIPKVNNNKMIYIPNYVDIDLFQPGSRAPDGMLEILFPRRNAPERGIYTMQVIMPQMLAKYPKLRFNLAIDQNSPQMTAEWEAWWRVQPQLERILYGHYPLDLMPEVYRRADIVVVPSVWAEGTSLSVLEAMACAKPVVCTHVGGLANLVLPNFNGKIVNTTSVAVKTALEEYIKDPAERLRHGENARRVAEQAFTKKRWAGQWTQIIHSVFGSP